MRENIEWLIELYTRRIERLEQDAKERTRGIGMTYITGAIRAYSEVVEDLQNILDESEDEE